MGNKAFRSVHRTILPKFNASIYPRLKDKAVTNRPEIEMLARMWIECDPNRGGEGCGPDDLIHEEGDLNSKPRWHWFIPRAQSSVEFFERNGYVLRAKT